MAPSPKPTISTTPSAHNPGHISGKNLALITALGFSSGLPLALSGFTLRMWLTTDHVGVVLIGFTANLGLAYTLKFLWAPVFDEIRPLFLGRRRGWLLLVQF
jgi:PAT family beta-lactamase induction signal transducer AmpG